jgi:hypothetical protein
VEPFHLELEAGLIRLALCGVLLAMIKYLSSGIVGLIAGIGFCVSLLGFVFALGFMFTGWWIWPLSLQIAAVATLLVFMFLNIWLFINRKQLGMVRNTIVTISAIFILYVMLLLFSP